MPPSAATGTTDNTAPASAPSSSSASGAASSGTPSSASTSAPASGAGPSGGSADSALAALERVAAASAEVASSAANTDNAPAGGGSPPASTEPATSAPAGSATRPSDASATAAAQHADNTPEHRITAAVRNARAEVETELGWARSLGPREEAERAVQLARRLFADPSAFARQLQSELQAEQEPEELELVDPQPTLRSEDGRLAYTDEQSRQIAANAVERARRELRKEFAPALEYSRTAVEREQQQQVREEAGRDAQAIWNTAGQLPHFKQYQKDIDRVYRDFNTTNPEIRQKYGSAAVLYMAYNKVLAEKVLPTLGATAERQTIADLQRSAHAGNHGIATTPPVPVKPVIREGNVDDLARDLERRYAEAAAAH